MSASLVKLLFEFFNVLIILDSGSVSGFFDQRLHYEDIKAILFFDEFSRSILACEGVTDQTQFQRQPVRCLGVLQAGPRIMVELNDLLETVAKKEIVGGLVLKLEVVLFKHHVVSGVGCLGVLATLAGGSVFNGCAHQLFNQLFVGSHELYRPLSFIGQVVN